MKAFRIKELNHFMSRLLKSDAFDCFLLSEGTVVTYNIAPVVCFAGFIFMIYGILRKPSDKTTTDKTEE